MAGRKPILATLIIDLVTYIRNGLLKAMEPKKGEAKKKTDHKKWD